MRDLSSHAFSVFLSETLSYTARSRRTHLEARLQLCDFSLNDIPVCIRSNVGNCMRYVVEAFSDECLEVVCGFFRRDIASRGCDGR